MLPLRHNPPRLLPMRPLLPLLRLLLFLRLLPLLRLPLQPLPRPLLVAICPPSSSNWKLCLRS